MENNTKSLPMIPLRELTVLPEMVIHFDVSREKSIAAIERAMEEQQKLFLTTQKKAETDEPGIEDVYETGCIATIKQIIKLPKRLNRILIAVDERARLNYIEDTEQCLMANVTVVEDIDTLAEEIGADKFPMNVEAMILGLKELFKEYTDKNPKVYKELASQIGEISDLKKLVDVIAANFPLPYIQRQELLEEVNLMRRYDMLVAKIVHEVQVQSIKEELQSKVKRRVDKNQREYMYGRTLIREELGDDSTISDADEFAQAVDKLQSPDEVKQKISKEIKRFRSIMNSPSETGVIRTYIETMLEMPWDKVCKEHKDIKYAKKVLDEDHYGLEKVKERILEYMAVRALTKKGDSPILCLAGPPGTGKTSIAKSLARALKRPYVRISLGGVRDEAVRFADTGKLMWGLCRGELPMR